jgi:O-antigen/teichoic acid export membrane protein
LTETSAASPGMVRWVWRHLRAERFYRDSAWLTMALLTVNLSNYVLNVAVSRILGRAQFGAVAAILALLYVLNVPTSAIQTLLTREVAQIPDPDELPAVYRSIRRVVWRWAAVATLATLALTPLVVAFLHLDSFTPALFLPLLVGLALLVPMYRGILQGRRRFALLTANIGAEAALRVVGAILLTLLGFQAAGVMGAFALGLVASLVLGRVFTRRDLGSGSTAALSSASSHLLELLPVVAGLGLVTAAFNVDVILARHFLRPVDGGEYAAVSLVARVLFYLTSSVGGAVVASRIPPQPRGRLKLLAQGLAVVVGTATAGELACLLFPRAVVVGVFGSAYAGAASVLPLLGAGMVALSATNLLVYFLLAMRLRAFAVLQLIGLALEVGLIAWHHATLNDIAVAFTAASVAVAVSLGTIAVLSALRSGLVAPAGDTR